MTVPSPSQLPPPGWYRDPQWPSIWRYWDGSAWTHHTAPVVEPVAVQAPDDPYSFSAWFGESARRAWSATKRLGLVVGVSWGAVFLVSAAMILAAAGSSDGKLLRRWFETSDSFRVRQEVSDDRAADAARDLFWTWLPWLIVLFVVAALLTAWTMAVAAHTVDDEIRADRDEGSPRGPASLVDLAVFGIRRVPAVVGASLAVLGLMLASIALGFLPLVVSAAFGAPVAINAALGVVGACAGIALGLWVLGRLSLAVAAGAIGGRGVGLAWSWRATNGRFWHVVGRVLVASLLAASFGGVVNAITSFSFLFGLSAYLVALVLQQVVGMVSTTLITAPAQVVVIHHLEASDRASSDPNRAGRRQ